MYTVMSCVVQRGDFLYLRNDSEKKGGLIAGGDSDLNIFAVKTYSCLFILASSKAIRLNTHPIFC